MAMLSGFLPMRSWERLEGVPVPNHFDIHGVVDGVGDRGILLTLALIGLGIYIIMEPPALPAFLIRRQLHTLGGRRQDADAEYVVHLGDSGPDAGLHRYCHFPHLPQITYFE